LTCPFLLWRTRRSPRTPVAKLAWPSTCSNVGELVRIDLTYLIAVITSRVVVVVVCVVHTHTPDEQQTSRGTTHPLGKVTDGGVGPGRR
jgi:hypothetical protein